MNSYIAIFNLTKNEESDKLEQMRFILLHLFVFLLPFDKFYSTLILYLLIFTTLIDFKKERLRKIPKSFWIFQIVFLLSLSGYFYSFNVRNAGSLVERQLVFLIFPILLPMAIDITKEKVKQLLTTLVISCIVVAILLFTSAFYNIIQLNLPFSVILSKSFFNHNFSKPIEIHAGYLAFYFSISFIYVSTLIPNQKRMLLIGSTFCSILLLIALFFLAARTILIYIFFVMMFIYPFIYIKKRLRYFLICIILLSIGFLIIKNNRYLNNRFTTELLNDIKPDGITSNLESEPRVQRWKLGLNLALESPIIGHGTGDEVDLLREKYKENNFVISYVHNFNIHNQYLSILIKHGFIGLSIFLISFLYFFRLAYRSKNYLYFLFLIGICTFFLTENVLDSNKGIFFFAFFNVLFGYSTLNNKQELNPVVSFNESK